jgi:hypothetical protein
MLDTEASLNKPQEIGEKCIMRSFITCTTSPNLIRMIMSRRMRWAGHEARMREDEKNAYKILVGKPEENRPLGRPRCSWVDNIRIDLRMG